MRRWLSGLIGAQLLAGCSLVFTREPRYAPERPDIPADCTESRAAPIADTAVTGALFMAAGALIAWGVSSPRGEAGALRITAALAPASYGTMEGIVAIVGFQRTRRCERIRAAQRRCLQGDRDGCATLQADDASAPAAP